MVVILILVIIFLIWKYLPRENKRNVANTVFNTTERSAALLNSSISKAKKSIEKTISKSYITNCSWILTNELNDNVLYSFLNNDELLITTNGIVKKANYQIIIDNNSLLITIDGVIIHYNIVNMRDDFLFMNKVSTNEILFFANRTKFKDELKSIVYKQAQDLYFEN